MSEQFQSVLILVALFCSAAGSIIITYWLSEMAFNRYYGWKRNLPLVLLICLGSWVAVLVSAKRHGCRWAFWLAVFVGLCQAIFIFGI